MNKKMKKEKEIENLCLLETIDLLKKDRKQYKKWRERNDEINKIFIEQRIKINNALIRKNFIIQGKQKSIVDFNFKPKQLIQYLKDHINEDRQQLAEGYLKEYEDELMKQIEELDRILMFI